MKDESRFHARLWTYRADAVFNPWAQCDPLDESMHTVGLRRLALDIHFDKPAKYLLIGEAPGYRGCHFSGVPFTSEAQLPHRTTSLPHPLREASSTIMHNALAELGIADKTVMWNAFPFHPFIEGHPTTNRAPTVKELADTRDILDMVLSNFAQCLWIAVGKVAAHALERTGRTYNCCVRHPSMGGAAEFREHMKRLIV